MKYRSLVFNIKDEKNTGLFRKILQERISPRHLVSMSADELASKEKELAESVKTVASLKEETARLKKQHASEV